MDVNNCQDWVEVNNGTTTQRFCGYFSANSSACGNNCPSTVTGTTITVKLHTSSWDTASGFFAVVTGDATVTTDVTGESGLGKYIIK